MRHIAQFNEENKWKIQEGDICPKCGEVIFIINGKECICVKCHGTLSK